MRCRDPDAVDGSCAAGYAYADEARGTNTRCCPNAIRSTNRNESRQSDASDCARANGFSDWSP